jgi:hypothetical protein
MLLAFDLYERRRVQIAAPEHCCEDVAQAFDRRVRGCMKTEQGASQCADSTGAE